MRKLALVFAAAAALVIVAGPLTKAVAADKKLWDGWVEEMQKAAGGVMADKKK